MKTSVLGPNLAVSRSMHKSLWSQAPVVFRKALLSIFASSFLMTSALFGHSAAAHGTQDVGVHGGILINGRPIESYALHLDDPKEAPEYQQFIAPIMADIAKLGPGGGNHFGALVSYLIKERAWYKVPVEVDKIPATAMNVPFVAYSQGADQTDHSVWIAEPNLPEQPIDRAKLYLHEILVGIKVLRHLSPMEKCSAQYYKVDRDLESWCSGLGADSIFANSNLSPTDYDDVRFMVDWLFENHATMTAESLSEEFARKQFFGSGFVFFADFQQQGNDQIDSELRREHDRNFDYALTQAYHFYADYDRYTHRAQSLCEIRFVRNHDTVRFVAKIVNRATKRVLSQRSAIFDVRQLARNEIPSNAASPWPRTSYMLSNAGPFQKAKVHDLSDMLGINFIFSNVSQMSYERMEVLSEKMSEGIKGQRFECTSSEILIPWDYDTWMVLPKNDREALEKDYFGDTVANIRAAGKVNLQLP